MTYKITTQRNIVEGLVNISSKNSLNIFQRDAKNTACIYNTERLFMNEKSKK